jgi:hypothetical protein
MPLLKFDNDNQSGALTWTLTNQGRELYSQISDIVKIEGYCW